VSWQNIIITKKLSQWLLPTGRANIGVASRFWPYKLHSWCFLPSVNGEFPGNAAALRALATDSSAYPARLWTYVYDMVDVFEANSFSNGMRTHTAVHRVPAVEHGPLNSPFLMLPECLAKTARELTYGEPTGEMA
jgi:hypothetical protein